MGIIIIILAVLCVLFATGKIDLKNNNIIGKHSEEENIDNILDNEILNEEIERLSNWVFNYINSLNIYCGDNMKWNNESDFIPAPNLDYMYLYDVFQDFKSISELNSYIKTYISDDMISAYSRSGYLYDLYKEQDGKLYCLN